MRLTTRTITAPLAALALGGIALAQETAGATVDASAWFVDTAALAVVVAATVGFIKANVLKNLAGLAVVLLSLVTGTVFGLAGALLGYIEGGPGAGAAFGVAAGFLASGGWDVITGMLGKRTGE